LRCPARIGRADYRGPLKIPTVMMLKTLADVRELIARHLPAECRERDTWRHVSDRLAEAARAAATSMRQ